MNETKETTSAPVNLSDTQDVLDALNRAGLTAVVHEPKGNRVQAPALTPQAVTVLEMADAEGGVNVAELFGALAKAQGEFGDIERTMTAKIQSKREGGANYTYDYAPLDVVLAAVRPALSKNGIALMQFPQTKQHAVTVRTLLAHESGQRIWNDFSVGCTSTDAKDIGSAVTYARRYSLMALLGIAPDTDDDGGRARGDGTQVQSRSQTDRPRQQNAPDPERRNGEPKSIVTSVRTLKRGGRDIYAVKSTTGECFTEDATLRDVAEAAMRAERPVVLGTEVRREGAKAYNALVEIR